MKRKVITKKITKLPAKSHKLKCSKCETTVICSPIATEVMCPICVASMVGLKLKSIPKKKTKVKSKAKRVTRKSLPKTKKKGKK